MSDLISSADALLKLGVPGVLLVVIWALWTDRQRLLKSHSDLAEKHHKCLEEKTEIFRQQAAVAMAKIAGSS